MERSGDDLLGWVTIEKELQIEKKPFPHPSFSVNFSARCHLILQVKKQRLNESKELLAKDQMAAMEQN